MRMQGDLRECVCLLPRKRKMSQSVPKNKKQNHSKKVTGDSRGSRETRRKDTESLPDTELWPHCAEARQQLFIKVFLHGNARERAKTGPESRQREGQRPRSYVCRPVWRWRCRCLLWLWSWSPPWWQRWWPDPRPSLSHELQRTHTQKTNKKNHSVHQRHISINIWHSFKPVFTSCRILFFPAFFLPSLWETALPKMSKYSLKILLIPFKSLHLPSPGCITEFLVLWESAPQTGLFWPFLNPGSGLKGTWFLQSGPL